MLMKHEEKSRWLKNNSNKSRMHLNSPILKFSFDLLSLLGVTSASVNSEGTEEIRNNGLKPTELNHDDDALFLTPYIEHDQITKAQELAVVKPLLKGVESFAGFLTVNKTCSSNLFFWLFKSSAQNWEERPLIVWLQGGPGSSSMFGLLMEVGPILVTKKRRLKLRKYSWNRKYNLVFIDNPVGAGFSFTNLDAGYAINEADVARDLYEALVQLYTLFPALQKNKLFITGESYAGKYIPAIGYKIYEMNMISAFKLPLAGLMIGNAWTDPLNMHNYAAYLYELGLIDENQKENLTKIEEDVRADIRAGKFMEARKDDVKENRNIHKWTGLQHIFDFETDDVPSREPEINFLNRSTTRKAIHVGSYSFNDGSKTFQHLEADSQQSVKPLVEGLLSAEEFPILYYSGQLDILVAYPLSLGFFQSLRWPRAKDYHKAKRCQFRVGTDVTGYYKSAGTLTEVLVRNAGHKVPVKQPKCAYEIMDRFISNITFFECH